MSAYGRTTREALGSSAGRPRAWHRLHGQASVERLSASACWYVVVTCPLYVACSAPLVPRFDYPRSIVVPSKLTYQLVHRHAPRIHDVEDSAICHACVEQTAAVRHAIELRHPLKCIVLVARPKKSRGGAMSDRYHRYSAQSLRSPFGADRSSISVAAIARGNALIKKRRNDEQWAVSTPPTVPRWASLMQRVVPNICFLGKNLRHKLLSIRDHESIVRVS